MDTWQQKVIDQNIHALLENTFCEHLFVAKLSHFLNPQEVEFLINGTRSNHQKAYQLYTILKTRVNSFDGLKKALNETNQTGVLDILNRASNGREKYTQYMSLSLTSNEVAYETNNTFRVYPGVFATRSALVKLFKDEDEELKKAVHEIEMLKRLDWHENIVRCYIGKHITKQQQQGIKEYFAVALDYETPLDVFIKDCNTRRTFAHKMDILNQIWNGITFLHSNEILHLDLKPQSILVSRSNNSHTKIKIGELGSAHQIDANNTPNFPLENLEGLAVQNTPEVLQHKRNFWTEAEIATAHIIVELNYSTDVFCLGLITYYVLSGGRHAFGRLFDIQTGICKNRPKVEDEYLNNVEKNAFLALISASTSERQKVPYFQTVFKTNE